MKHEQPNELTELEDEIKRLQLKRDELKNAWLNRIAPFKVDQRVMVKKGKTRRTGTVISQQYKYDSWEYCVTADLKKGGTQFLKVYSWDTIEAMPQ